jgi:hypothetical protein
VPQVCARAPMRATCCLHASHLLLACEPLAACECTRRL